MKIVVLVATIGDQKEVDHWLVNHEKYFGNSNVHFIINNSKDESIELWDSIPNIEVYHTEASGIINAFNFLVTKVSKEYDYFVHAGIDDVMINLCENDYKEDLVFLPVIDAKFSGVKRVVRVRKPFSYFLNNRPYSPHHQGCLYSTRLAKELFYTDFGICFDAHKTLRLVEEEASYVVDNTCKPLFEMWEGGLSSDVKSVLESNETLTADLDWKPSRIQVVINRLINKIRYGNL